MGPTPNASVKNRLCLGQSLFGVEAVGSRRHDQRVLSLCIERLHHRNA